MAEQEDKAPNQPGRKPKPKPPMSRVTQLALRAVDYVADATRRDDGTVNRRVLSLLDPRVPAFSSPCRGIASRDLILDPAHVLRARLFFHPTRAAEPLPVIVFFHGGGFAFLSAGSLPYDAACRRIARHAKAHVLSVDYRRAPEHKFPAPYDDGFSALRFLDDPGNHPSDAQLDVSRVFLAGDSAGGNIAHHVSRRYAAAESSTFSNVRIKGLIAIQPFFGGEERTGSELLLDGAPIVSVPRTDWMWRAFLPPGADRTHEAACPDAAAKAVEEEEEFPPVLLVVGGYDPLQDWQRRYGEALRGKGKEVEVLEYPEGIHAFFLFPEFRHARDLMLRIAEFVAGGAADRRGGA